MHVLPLSVVAGNHEWVPTLLKHYIDGFILIIGIPRSPKRISISSCADCPISDVRSLTRISMTRLKQRHPSFDTNNQLFGKMGIGH